MTDEASPSLSAARPLCGNRMPGARAEIQPCPLDEGHEGEHVYFVQTAEPTQKRGRNGVWVYGEDGVVRQHMTFEGYVTPGEVGVMVAYLDYVHTALGSDNA